MNFFEDLYAQSKTSIGNSLADSMSNVAANIVSNQIQTMFKIEKPAPAAVPPAPVIYQAPSVVSGMMDNKVVWIAGGAALLIAVVLIIRR